MLHTYLTAKVARHIAAFLFMGSAMGFVLGQQLGHRPISAALHVATPRSAVVAQHALGGLGTPTVAQPARGMPVAQQVTAPTQRESHAKKDKHEKDGDSGGHGDSAGSGGHGGGGDGGGGKGGGSKGGGGGGD